MYNFVPSVFMSCRRAVFVITFTFPNVLQLRYFPFNESGAFTTRFVDGSRQPSELFGAKLVQLIG